MEQVLWFGWFRADIIAEYAVLFWRGLQMTMLVTLICIVQGTALGLAIGMARLAEARPAALQVRLALACHGVCELFPRHPAVCADSADSLCGAAAVHQPGRRPADFRRNRAQPETKLRCLPVRRDRPH